MIPKTLDDMVGNRLAIKRAIDWISTFVEIKKGKCLLLAGPEGVGKTLFTQLFCKEYSYDIQEFGSVGNLQVFLEKAHSTRFVFGSSKKLVVLDEFESISVQDKLSLSILETYVMNRPLRHPMIITASLDMLSQIEKRPMYKQCDLVRFHAIPYQDITRFMITFNSSVYDHFHQTGRTDVLHEICKNCNGSMRAAKIAVEHEIVSYRDTCDVEMNEKTEKLEKEDQKQLLSDYIDPELSLMDTVMGPLNNPQIRKVIIGDVCAVISGFYENIDTELFEHRISVKKTKKLVKEDDEVLLTYYKTCLNTLCDLDAIERRLLTNNDWSMRPIQEECMISLVKQLNQIPKTDKVKEVKWLGGTLWTRGSLKIQNRKRIQQIHRDLDIPTNYSFYVSDYILDRTKVLKPRGRTECQGGDKPLVEMAIKRLNDFAIYQ